MKKKIGIQKNMIIQAHLVILIGPNLKVKKKITLVVQMLKTGANLITVLLVVGMLQEVIGGHLQLLMIRNIGLLSQKQLKLQFK